MITLNPISPLITDILTQFSECFQNKGFVFMWSKKNGRYLGSEIPSYSGGYVQIGQYLDPNDCMIQLLHADTVDLTCPYDREARRIIHQHIMMELIHNRRSPDSGYFLRQDLLKLKEVGIDQVVASLVRLHRQYDQIWSSLEALKIREQVAASLKLFAKSKEQTKQSVAVVVGENFPTPTESTIPEPS